MAGLDLNNMLPGVKSDTLHKSEVFMEQKEPILVPTVRISNKNITEVFEPTKVAPKKEVFLQLLICPKCNVVVSVGKEHKSSLFNYKMCCPMCSTSYSKSNYVVDTNSKLWHRPFSELAQKEFDTEVSRLKTLLKYQEISLVT